jgi:rhodanese-related sulfurtransferase/TusA-related sulfurtransferase
MPMTLKLIFNDEGAILGAQGIGYDGVDKRIDIIAAVIRLNGTVQDLTELELSYAPPFSAAKDPVNMAGYAAQNILAERTHVAAWHDIEQYKNDGYTLVDVRSREEFDNGHIQGAVNIPVDSLRERIGELDPNKTIIEYCQVGLRGYIADRILSQKGFKVFNVTGGYKTVSALNFDPQKVGADSNSEISKRITVDPDTQTVKENESQTEVYDKALDACGLCCPGPLVQVKTYLDDLKDGQILKVSASDPGFFEDIKVWCKRNNHELVNILRSGGIITAFIKKNAKH